MSKKPAAAKKTDYTPTDVYQLITDRFISALEGGTIPWRKPWNEQYGAPRNYATGRAYTGVNAFLLHFSSEVPFFLTFKQALDLGGHIRKGAHGFPVVYFQVGKKKNKETQEDERVFILKKYTVFSVLDVEGVELKLPELVAATHTPIEAAEAIVKGWAGCPPIVSKQQRAYYSPGLDYLNMPKAESFTSPAYYYSVLFHELTHATGHPSRLNRNLSGAFGSADYAREELTAEMGAAFLGASAGLKDPQLFENSTAYIQNWLNALRNDKKLVISAGSKASKAAALILGTDGPEDDEAAEQPSGTAPSEAAAGGGTVPPPAGEPAASLASAGPAAAADAFTLRTYRLNVRRVLGHPAFSAVERSVHEAAANACLAAPELAQLKAVLLLIAERWEDAQPPLDPAPAGRHQSDPEPLAAPQLSDDHHEVIAYAVVTFGYLRPYDVAQQAGAFADQIARAYALETPQTKRVCEVLRAHPTYALPFRSRLAG